ncbi:hypothetical protein [Sphingobium sp. CECT 9361]|uniref:hypothetical protein n=1 Tax=Sphingobium sp. CECT 9361 TaxID=2845384 RepID=UPI001E4500D3|nr:hypothetical protein [Sphingobium sp. CECT 9361]
MADKPIPLPFSSAPAIGNARYAAYVGFLFRCYSTPENYDHLWSYLHEMKLLKSSSKHLDRKSAIAIEVGERAKLLSRSLNITSYRTMKKMAGNDTVVAGKVLLAAQRRSDKLYKFFIEGRAAIAGEEI